MNCALCKRKAVMTPTAKNGTSHSETFYSIRWNKVDKEEYQRRKLDGRALLITGVCPECIAKYNKGRPPLGLNDINKMREQKISQEEYYKQHGY